MAQHPGSETPILPTTPPPPPPDAWSRLTDEQRKRVFVYLMRADDALENAELNAALDRLGLAGLVR